MLNYSFKEQLKELMSHHRHVIVVRLTPPQQDTLHHRTFCKQLCLKKENYSKNILHLLSLIHMDAPTGSTGGAHTASVHRGRQNQQKHTSSWCCFKVVGWRLWCSMVVLVQNIVRCKRFARVVLNQGTRLNRLSPV